jgi:hypothetical protein
MTQTVIFLQALATIALTWGAPIALLALAALAVKGPRYTVAALNTRRTATRHWTHRQAVAAARARTERTGVLFSVNWEPLV